jgi:iron(III) transport system substrate-binding protein
MEGLLREFLENGVKLLPGNSVVRDRVGSGELKCGLTDSDDAFVALERGMPIGVVFPDQEPTYPGLAEPLGTFVFPNTVSLIAGGSHPELARKVIDFLLRPETEEALAQGESAQIPVRPGLRGPERLRVPTGLIRMEVSWEEMAKAADACVPFLRGLVER